MPAQTFARRFFRLAVPNILSNVTVPLVGLVDAAMLGHLRDIRFLAGVALGGVIFDYAYWSFGFLRMSTTGLVAQASGRGDEREAWDLLYRALAVAAGIAAVVLVGQVFIRDAGFALLPGTPGVEAAGREYFNARIWGAPATLGNYVLLGWLLGRERPVAALTMTLVGNLANVGLDYVFIVVAGWAAQGAGLATALAQLLMFVTGLLLIGAQQPRRPSPIRELFAPGRLRTIMALNRDILVRTLCLMTTFAAFTAFGARLGTTVLAANTLLLRLQMLAAYLIDGAAFATETLSGHLHGRGDRVGLRRLLRLASATGIAFAFPVMAAVVFVPASVFGLLTSHDDVVAVATRYAPWLVAVLAAGSLAFVYDGFLIGLTAGRVLRNQMLVSTFMFFLPLAWVAARLGSNHLLWSAMAVFMLGRFLTLWLGTRSLLRELSTHG